MFQLSDEFETTVELLSVAIEANPVALNPHVPSFVSRILSLMKSPLASAGACRLWLKLQFVVFPNSLAGLGTGYVLTCILCLKLTFV